MTKLLLNGTPYALPGVAKAKVDGRLAWNPTATTEDTAWVGGADGSGPTWQQKYDHEKLEAYAESIEEPYLVLDIEHDGPDIVGIIETIRSSNPALQIGLWSTLPASEYTLVQDYAAYSDIRGGRPHDARDLAWWAAPENGPATAQAFSRWKASNRLQARKLVPHVDFLCPKVYPEGEMPADRTKAWTATRFVDLTIAECRQLAPNKPVLACITAWNYAGKAMASDAMVKAIVNTALTKADGLIQWAQAELVSADKAASVMASATSQAEGADS